MKLKWEISENEMGNFGNEIKILVWDKNDNAPSDEKIELIRSAVAVALGKIRVK